VRLAVQLYTLRHKLEQDLEGTLAQLSEAGTTEVELAGFYDREPPAFTSIGRRLLGSGSRGR